jgi:hypothetical protein
VPAVILRRFRRWLRYAFPADFATVGLALLITIVGCVSSIRSKLGVSDAWEMLRITATMSAWISAVLYAAFRVYYFHPVENRAYGTWLANSPWRHPDRLPLGPPHCVWQDAFVVGLLMLIVPSEYSRLAVPTLFLFGYAACHAYSLARLEIYWPGYVVLFLFGCLVLRIEEEWWRLICVALMYPAAHFGVQKLLRRFPFSNAERDQLRLNVKAEPETIQPPTAGWPVPPARIERWRWSISHVNAVLVAAAAGWLLYCFAQRFQEVPDFRDGMYRALTFATIACVVGRVAIYTFGHAPPVSLLGRVATGRLIIPGYDSVFVAPLIAATAAWSLSALGEWLGMSPGVYVPITCGIVVWLSLALPPRREDWHLTGHHRIAYRFRALWMQANSSKQRRSMLGQ